jgi:hypothetical protein
MRQSVLEVNFRLQRGGFELASMSALSWMA